MTGPQYGPPPGHGPVPGYGPAPGYGPPAGYAPPGYGPPGYGPPGYGYPPAPPVPGPVARPAAATTGVGLFALAAVLGVVGAVLVLANRDAYVQQALQEIGFTDPELSGGFGGAFVDTVSTATTTFSAVLGLLSATVCGTVSAFAWQGRGWARIVLWVLAGLGVLGVLGAVQAPLAVIAVVGVVQVTALVGGAVLLALGPVGHWYGVVARRRTAGLPG